MAKVKTTFFVRAVGLNLPNGKDNVPLVNLGTPSLKNSFKNLIKKIGKLELKVRQTVFLNL